jgi:signal transduction histidine kinase
MSDDILNEKVLDSRFKTLISNLQEGILVENQNREIIYVNKIFCEMFHFEAEPSDLIGVDCSNAADESKNFFNDPKKFKQRILDILQSKQIIIGDELETINGQYFERDYVPVFVDSIYLGHMWKYRDITNQKRIIKELEILNRFKDQMFSIIAHDLRNPLASLKQILEFLDNDMISLDELKECIPELHSRSLTVIDLLDNLLNWASANLKKYELSLSETNIKIFIDSIFRSVQNIANKKGIRLINEIDNNLFLNLDENLLKIVIRNLITNSIKFTNPGGFIKINADLNMISIEDNGIGMTSETIDNIFDKNEIISTYGTCNEQGSGLGLVLCKEFIKKHNGRFDIESQVDIGTKIKIYLN